MINSDVLFFFDQKPESLVQSMHRSIAERCIVSNSAIFASPSDYTTYSNFPIFSISKRSFLTDRERANRCSSIFLRLFAPLPEPTFSASNPAQ